ncbi:MAG: hypothetical protein IJP67_00690 [Oscillospiraceae bacterium]|nr:hypothetical protein [Oscillospiraceae bacterium]MBR0062663.1 hypothetical protein [Oscillospiraceae bacterium]
MKLKETQLSAEFLSAVQKCAGEVYFDTSAGDHLNLKSELSELVFTVIINKLDALDYHITFEARDSDIIGKYLV